MSRARTWSAPRVNLNHRVHRACNVIPAATQTPVAQFEPVNSYYENECNVVTSIEVEGTENAVGPGVGCTAKQDIANADQEVCVVPESAAITAVDACNHPLIGGIATGRSEIAGLALWLLAERHAPTSGPNLLVQALPATTLSPILWPEEFRHEALRGSPVLNEARDREVQIREEFASILDSLDSGLPKGIDSSWFNEQNFLESFSVAVAHSIYLPSAQCFALVPFASFMARTGNDNGCEVDYETEREAVVVKTMRPYKAGQAVLLNDFRPNSEQLLATGSLQEENMSDYILYDAFLVPTDKLYTVKREVLEAQGLKDKESFPLYEERFPIQLLNYLRFSRIQDVGQLAKLSFEKDVIITPENEYEALQLIMADLRERLQGYLDNAEEDAKQLQDRKIRGKERLALQLLQSEKDILLSTTDAIRQRLAPIRGIPSKSGRLEDPNQDLLEIFEAVEGIGSAPQRLWKGFSRWASGKDDPDWKR